ncbi:hypothetical protein Tco_0678720 [Tanacetum coccineum]|uniref:Uncharacterized protein n=1 Tax=Tanacetum coccineum TaxID=301880 RepID=A0ABQ4XH50_9ASTR
MDTTFLPHKIHEIPDTNRARVARVFAPGISNRFGIYLAKGEGRPALVVVDVYEFDGLEAAGVTFHFNTSTAIPTMENFDNFSHNLGTIVGHKVPIPGHLLNLCLKNHSLSLSKWNNSSSILSGLSLGTVLLYSTAFPTPVHCFDHNSVIRTPF